MPIYEYRCASCGFEKEYLQKLSDAPIAACERCGESAMTKLVSAAGFHLKGSGWYVTDFKNNNAKPPPKEATKADAGQEGSESKAGDAKSGDAKSAENKAVDDKSGGAGTASAEGKSSSPAEPGVAPRAPAQ
jgi:putative FmdB family regulatory protein